MKYLHDLRDFINNHVEGLNPEKVHLFIEEGEQAADKAEVRYTARFLFLDVRGQTPFDVTAKIRHWFKTVDRDIPDITFSSEVIDKESYDLEVDMQLVDSVVVDSMGNVRVCPPTVWDEDEQDFVSVDGCGC